MPKTVAIGRNLEEVMREENLQQKYIAYETKTPVSTFSDHVNNKQVQANKVVEYAEALNNSNFTYNVANKLFGTIKALDSDLFNTDSPNDLDVLEMLESDERHQKKLNAQRVLAMRHEKISAEDKAILQDYANEFLDEIILELSIVMSVLKVCDTSLMTATSRRMPYWISKGYMRKE